MSRIGRDYLKVYEIMETFRKQNVRLIAINDNVDTFRGEVHPLSGLMYCYDCGSKMYVHRTSNYKNIPYYTCSACTKVPCGSLCKTAHRIKAENVLTLIAEILTDIKNEIKTDENEFLANVQGILAENSLKDFEENKDRLKVVDSRLDELENLICRIYKDMITEKLPSHRYETLNSTYEKEQKTLKKE